MKADTEITKFRIAVIESLSEEETQNPSRWFLNAIKEFKKCKSERVGQPAVEDALKELKLYFVSSEGDVGELRILHGKRNEYEAILSDLNGEFLAECKTYLAKAVEKHLDFEKIVSEEQSRNMVEQAIAKAEAENRKKKTDIT